MSTILPEQRSPIRARFAGNLDRVRSLVGVYEQLGAGASGRRSIREADLLRAAVVLLHATTEDLLRSLAGFVLPAAEPAVLKELEIPFVGPRNAKVPKISLPELAAHRGASVDDLVRRTVHEWLEFKTFNNVGEVRAILEAIGFPSALATPYDRRMAAMMARRHLIVHRADRQEATGAGRSPVQSLSKALVSAWIQSIDAFGSSLLDQIDEEGPR